MDEVVEVAGPDLANLAGDIVSAYVSRNNLPAMELPALLISVHAALSGLGTLAVAAEPEVEKATPYLIRKSITPDHLISFIDGKPYKTIKRHLTTHGLTIETYRARYGLPVDYPVVSANYSEARAALAKSFGLGQRRRKDTAAVVPAPVVEVAPAMPKRGRKPKAEPVGT